MVQGGGGGGASLGISMSCLSCVRTVVGKICSAWSCTYPART